MISHLQIKEIAIPSHDRKQFFCNYQIYPLQDLERLYSLYDMVSNDLMRSHDSFSVDTQII